MDATGARQAGLSRRLEGRVALVTGGGGTDSIGRSISLRLAAGGATRIGARKPAPQQ